MARGAQELGGLRFGWPGRQLRQQPASAAVVPAELTHTQAPVITPRPEVHSPVAQPHGTQEISRSVSDSPSFKALSIVERDRVKHFQPGQLEMFDIATELKEQADRVMRMGELPGSDIPGFVRGNNIPVAGFPDGIYHDLVYRMPSEAMIQQVWDAFQGEYHGLQTPQKLPFVFLTQGVDVQDMVGLMKDPNFHKWYTTIGRLTEADAKNIPAKILDVRKNQDTGELEVRVLATGTRTIHIEDRVQTYEYTDTYTGEVKTAQRTISVSENGLIDASLNADWRLWTYPSTFPETPEATAQWLQARKEAQETASSPLDWPVDSGEAGHNGHNGYNGHVAAVMSELAVIAAAQGSSAQAVEQQQTSISEATATDVPAAVRQTGLGRVRGWMHSLAQRILPGPELSYHEQVRLLQEQDQASVRNRTFSFGLGWELRQGAEADEYRAELERVVPGRVARRPQTTSAAAEQVQAVDEAALQAAAEQAAQAQTARAAEMVREYRRGGGLNGFVATDADGNQRVVPY